MHEEIKRILNFKNAYRIQARVFCLSVFDLKPFSLLHTCTCRFLDFAFFWCATWSLAIREEHRLRSCEKRLKRNAFVSKRKEGRKPL
jgi:hypothetical protein